jgi:hypothetical protein
MDGTSDQKPAADASIVDDLLSRTRHFLKGVIADYLKRSIEEFLGWMMGRVARYVLAASLFIMAAAFLLVGGGEGLIIAGLPPYLAHLLIGAVSLLAGLVTLKCCERPAGRP